MDKIKLIYQSPRSHCCGQGCVAMAAGGDLAAAKKAIGKNGCTSTKDLQRGLKKLGVRSRGGKLKAIYGDLAKLPETCILKVVSPWRRSGWHWVFKSKKKIYCPSRGYFMTADYETKADNKITSYLEIFTGPGAYGTKPGGPVNSTNVKAWPGLYVQQAGRAKRTKGPVVLDFTGTMEGERRFLVPSPCTKGIRVLNEIEQGPWPQFVRGILKSLIIAEYQDHIIAHKHKQY